MIEKKIKLFFSYRGFIYLSQYFLLYIDYTLMI